MKKIGPERGFDPLQSPEKPSRAGRLRNETSGNKNKYPFTRSFRWLGCVSFWKPVTGHPRGILVLLGDARWRRIYSQMAALQVTPVVPNLDTSL